MLPPPLSQECSSPRGGTDAAGNQLSVSKPAAKSMEADASGRSSKSACSVHGLRPPARRRAIFDKSYQVLRRELTARQYSGRGRLHLLGTMRKEELGWFPELRRPVVPHPARDCGFPLSNCRRQTAPCKAQEKYGGRTMQRPPQLCLPSRSRRRDFRCRNTEQTRRDEAATEPRPLPSSACSQCRCSTAPR